MNPVKGKIMRIGVRWAVLVCCAVLASAGCSARRGEQHRVEGDSYLRLGRLEEASRSYQQAETENPRDPLAKLGVGRCLLAQKQLDAGLAKLREAIGLDPALEPAYVESANALLGADRPSEAQALVEELAQADAERGGMLRGYVLLRLGKAAEARDALLELRDAYPRSADVRLLLASAYLGVKDPAAAEKELRTALDELRFESPGARMALVDACNAQGSLEALAAELQARVKEEPDRPLLRLVLARALVYLGRLQEAEEYMAGVGGAEREAAWANYARAAYLAQTGDRAEAAQTLAASMAGLTYYERILCQMALSLGAKEPERTAARAAAESGENVDWRALWRQAALRQLVARRAAFLVQDDSALLEETLLLAAVFAGDSATAAALAPQLPENSPVRAYWNALNQQDAAALMQQIRQWQEDQPERQLLLGNARGYALARSGARAQAIQEFAACLRNWPENAVAIYNTIQVYRQARMTDFAASAAQKLITTYPGNEEAYGLLFNVLREGERREDARKAAESAFALFPNVEESYLNLASAYMEQGELDPARQALRQGLQAFPDSAPLRLQLASVLLTAGDPEAAATSLETPVPAEDEARRLGLLAFAAARTDNWARVLELMPALGAAAPDTPLQLLFTAALAHAGRLPEAAALWTPAGGEPHSVSATAQAVLQALGVPLPEPAYPDAVALGKALAQNTSMLVEYAAAAAYQAAGLEAAALAGFEKVAAAVGKNPLLTRLQLGSLLRGLGLPNRVERARALVEQQPEDPELWVGLAGLYRSLGDAGKAAESLDRAAKAGPESPNVWMRRAIWLEEQGDYAGAADAYRRLAALLPDDPTANNNLAYCLLLAGGDCHEAMEMAKKAHEKLPSNMSVVHTLGLAQLRCGELDESERNLRMALEMRPGDPTLLLDYGQLLIAKNQPEEGKHQIELALRYAAQLTSPFARRAEAERILAGTAENPAP